MVRSTAVRDFPSPLRGGAGVGVAGPESALCRFVPLSMRRPFGALSLTPAPPPPLGLRPSRPSPQGGGKEYASDIS
jgi:hypothetical protein